MHGTFFINSAEVGTSGFYMNWSQVHDIADAGNEIGGHTLHHPDLTTISAAEATTEICDDRTALVNQGFTVTNFAYPYGHTNSSGRVDRPGVRLRVGPRRHGDPLARRLHELPVRRDASRRPTRT